MIREELEPVAARSVRRSPRESTNGGRRGLRDWASLSRDLGFDGRTGTTRSARPRPGPPPRTDVPARPAHPTGGSRRRFQELHKPSATPTAFVAGDEVVIGAPFPPGSAAITRDICGRTANALERECTARTGVASEARAEARAEGPRGRAPGRRLPWLSGLASFERVHQVRHRQLARALNFDASTSPTHRLRLFTVTPRSAGAGEHQTALAAWQTAPRRATARTLDHQLGGELRHEPCSPLEPPLILGLRGPRRARGWPARRTPGPLAARELRSPCRRPLACHRRPLR